MLEQLDGFPDNTIAVAAHGTVTAADYAATLTPAVEKALAAHAKVRVYYETAPDFTGYEIGAMWADARLGIGHLTRWERAAIVTDVEWLRLSVHGFAFMMPMTVNVFSTAEAAAAKAWLQE